VGEIAMTPRRREFGKNMQPLDKKSPRVVQVGRRKGKGRGSGRANLRRKAQRIGGG